MYNWWVSGKMVKYPSILHVTLKDKPRPNEIIETSRSKTPLEKESGRSILCDENVLEGTRESVKQEGRFKLPKLKRKSCLFPNKVLAEIDVEDDGCFIVKFSRDGLSLACSFFMDGFYNIFIYSVRILGSLISEEINRVVYAYEFYTILLLYLYLEHAHSFSDYLIQIITCETI